MPEWNGETRAQLYQHLREGRLEEARQLVIAFPDLKRNDLKPVDKGSLVELGRQIERDAERQRLMARMLGDARQPIWLVARLCFQHFEAFSGDALSQAFCDYMETVGRSTPATDREWGGRYWWPHNRIIDRLNDYAVFLLEFPTQNGLKSLTAIPNLVLQSWHITPEQHERKEQLMEQAQAEDWRGIVRRVALEASHATKKAVTAKKAESKAKKKTKEENGDPLSCKKGAQESPDGETSITSAFRSALIDQLKQYAKANWSSWPGPETIPAVDRQQMRPALEQLAQTLNVDALLQFELLDPPVASQGLIREFTKALIREYSRPTVLDAVDKLIVWLRKDCKTPEIILRGADVLCRSIERSVLEAADELDPLFAISRRQDDPQTIHYYTNPQDLNLKTLNEKSPDEIKDFLSRWDVCTWNGRPDYDRRTWQMDAIRMLQDQPAHADLIAARLTTCLESGSAMEMDWAFRLAFEKPERLGPDAHDLVRLTGCGLWQVKATDALKAVRRLHALAEFGRCEPAEAAAEIEKAFTIEEPMLWRAAAEAIRALRKKNPSIILKTDNRVREIMDRDPEKFGKYLKPLLT